MGGVEVGAFKVNLYGGNWSLEGKPHGSLSLTCKI